MFLCFLLSAGITCGLSAPFVAGQLDFAMKQKGCLPVLIGFNPTDMARSNKIEKWDKSFKDVVQTMEKGIFLDHN